MSFCILFAYYVLLSSSGTIDCNTDGECADGGTYTCDPDSEECKISCTANNACGGSIFECPQSSSCDITCQTSNGSACEKTHFYVYNSQSASFLFNGEDNQFMNGRIYCESGTECDVFCGVSGNSNGNDGMCRNTYFYASDASKLKITALGQETLTYSQIYCPEHGDCIIDSSTANSGNYKLYSSAIFINNPDTVNLELTCGDISSGDTTACYGDKPPILYCYNKTYSCSYETRNGHDWFCNEMSPCDMNNTFSPTSVPTNEPTSGNNNPGGKKGNGGVIAVIIILIIICCIITIFFAYRWNKKKKGGKYEGLLET